MRKILAIVVIVFISLSVSGQNFEGKIIYRNSFKSKISLMTDEQFNTAMGTRQEYYIRGGNYKSVSNGALSEWQLYIGYENKVYTKMTNSDTLLWTDGSKSADTIRKTEINRDALVILGYHCDELIFTFTNSVRTFYFSSGLPMDPQLYVHHTFGNWYDYLLWAHAVPLKMIIDNPNFTMESEATEVQPLKLDDKEFQLPVNAKSKKSPY